MEPHQLGSLEGYAEQCTVDTPREQEELRETHCSVTKPVLTDTRGCVFYRRTAKTFP